MKNSDKKPASASAKKPDPHRWVRGNNNSWIEEDYNPREKVYDNPHPVEAKDVPKSAGGDGPG